jgi:type IV fimbrial biogenesis protein FimT
MDGLAHLLLKFGDKENKAMRNESGFTLAELMVVIAIIAITSTIAIPGIIGWLPKYRLSSAAREILSAVEHARLTAVKQNASVGVSFATGSDTYRLWIDDGDGGGVADDAAENGTERMVKNGQMPAGVDMTAAIFGAAPQFRFNGMGIPTRTDGSLGGGNIVLINQRGDTRTVSITNGGNGRIQ